MSDEREGGSEDPPGKGSGGWLPPVAPGGGPPPRFEPAPPRPAVEGLPAVDAPYVTPAPAPQAAPQLAPPAPPPPYAAPGPFGAPPPGAPGASPYGAPPPAGYPPPQFAPSQPTNGSAIAALVLGISGIVLTIIFLGALFIVSLPCSVAAWILGAQGKRRAEGLGGSGRGMAQAGVVCAMVGIVLALIGAALWVVFFVVVDGDLSDLTESDPREPYRFDVIRLVGPTLRALLGIG